jgi:glycosyltransferase involved in cell wall biosynthesis
VSPTPLGTGSVASNRDSPSERTCWAAKHYPSSGTSCQITWSSSAPGSCSALTCSTQIRPPVQDNSDDGSSSGPAAIRVLRAIAHRAIKRQAYRRVVRNADRVVLNVPETREIITPWLTRRERTRLSATALELQLGFDPETFFFDPVARRAWRRLHAIEDHEFLLTTCTRVTASKKLEQAIGAVSALRRRGIVVRYILAGVLEDAYGEALRKHVERQPDPSAFLLLPALEHAEMRDLFSSADLGFWPQAAITIQQAMGTGLPVVLWERPSVSHLLVDSQNGWYVQPNMLEQVLTTAIDILSSLTLQERLSRRAERVEFNRTYLSYDIIALEMISGLHSEHQGSG